MRLSAISRGAGVPGPSFDGTVQSVFARAANLELGSGALVSLVAAELGDHPRAWRVDAHSGFNFAHLLAAGDRAACRAGVLRFEGRALSIDLGAARPWRCGIANLALDPRKPAVARALEVARRKLEAHPQYAELENIARTRIAQLADATLRFDDDAAARAIARLVGLGPGLTPAGDDYLVGFLAGLWSLEGSVARAAFRVGFAGHVAAAARATNQIGRAFLDAAAEGEVSARLATLAGALAHARPDGEIDAACDAALAVGASSGAAGVAGLLDAVAAFGTERAAARPRVTSS